MTEAPLRAFLMMRSDDGTWTVTVCRDLGAVMRTWKARKEPDRDVAVLHVGFNRPPSHTFDQIAGAHPGLHAFDDRSETRLAELVHIVRCTDRPCGKH